MLLPIEQVKSPLTIKVALDRVAKAELELTPEAMIMILKCTNHKVSIRDVLKMVPEEKEADFKEAICSAVEHREHTDANLERMREIAKIGGFEAEFEEAHAKEKLIGNTFGKTFIAESVEDLEKKTDLSGYGTVICDFDGYKTSVNADSKIFIAKSNKDLQANPDLTKYDMVICNFKGSTEFADLTKLPKKMIIKGDIDWCGEDFEQLPDISESAVYGSFNCNWCKKLTSLIGAPKVVGSGFYCFECINLESLKGAPREVGESFNCSMCNSITSLEGAPQIVGGDFNCSYCNGLTSAKGLPTQIARKIYCDDEFRPEIDKELEKRKKQANQSTLPPNGFGNSGR